MKKQERIRRALLKWMDEAGVSQRDIAHLAGCSQGTISNILNQKVVRAYGATLDKLDEVTKPWQTSGANDPSAIDNTPKLRDYLVNAIIDEGANWDQLAAAMHVADVRTAQQIIQEGRGDFYPTMLAGLIELLKLSVQKLPLGADEKHLLLNANVPRVIQSGGAEIDVVPLTATVDVDDWTLHDQGRPYRANERVMASDGREYRAFKLHADRGDRFRAGDVVLVFANAETINGRRAIVILGSGEIVCAKYHESGADVILTDAIGGEDFRTVESEAVEFASTVRQLIRTNVDG